MSKSAFETLVNIETQDIEWLWWPYIPYGMTTIVDGDPNVGKSFFVTHLAAAVSSGGKILSGKRVPKGKVLYFSGRTILRAQSGRGLKRWAVTPVTYRFNLIICRWMRRASKRGVKCDHGSQISLS